jgi:hypothetical protein
VTGLTRIFFCCDVHGSTKVFRKFLNAGNFYKADHIILAGDLTGKEICGIVKRSDGSEVHWRNRVKVFTEEHELEKLKETAENSGAYVYVTTEDNLLKMKDDENLRERVFRELIIERLQTWLHLAEEKMDPAKVKCYLMPGNDDEYCIDDLLNSNSVIINPSNKLIRIDEHEMISVPNSNITPWNCPRDISEEKLREIIETKASGIERLETSIFNIHVPPFNSRLDSAPAVEKQDGSLKMRPQDVPVGSRAVRDLIEELQPLLGFHGHIHESRGVCRIGRTVCINPGSEYSEGILRGTIVNLDKGKLKSYMLTAG